MHIRVCVRACVRACVRIYHDNVGNLLAQQAELQKFGISFLSVCADVCYMLSLKIIFSCSSYNGLTRMRRWPLPTLSISLTWLQPTRTISVHVLLCSSTFLYTVCFISMRFSIDASLLLCVLSLFNLVFILLSISLLFFFLRDFRCWQFTHLYNILLLKCSDVLMFNRLLCLHWDVLV